MRVPARLRRQQGRHALVDGVPFVLPVDSRDSPALMAAFPIDARRAAAVLPGTEVHPLRLWGDTGALIITVIDYRSTDIGRYVEFSIAIACTHGARPAPRLLPVALMRRYGTGQFVLDLPVSTEVSVKGGKGIWGMPKHQASLDFRIGDRTVSSQYDLDGRLAMRIEIDKPRLAVLPVRAGGANYCAFRGMLMRSRVFFRATAGVRLPGSRSARLVLGDHPRMDPLRDLGIGERPLITVWLPTSAGTLDDHVESWFLHHDAPPSVTPEGLESVADLGRGETWPPPPDPGLVPEPSR